MRPRLELDRLGFSKEALSAEGWVLGAFVLAVLFLAWAWLVRMGLSSGISICRAPTAVPAIGMWTVMMIAMMTPSALPMMLTFAQVTSRTAPSADRLALIGLFTAIYFVVWALVGAAAGTAEWLLTQKGFIQDGKPISPQIAAVLLVMAGLYQWSAVKSACLARCSEPHLFLLERYRSGYLGALKLGVQHSVACVGCCWILMLLAWVGGTMNLAWMVVLTLFVSIEKLMGAQPVVLRLSSLVLIGTGVITLLATL